MSLFICEMCDMVENSNLTRCTSMYDVVEDYPNMGTMDMHGYGEHDINYNKPVKGVKSADKSLMLCCECNTGTHHNEFIKPHPTDIEKEYSTYSKYSYITVYDHPISIDLLSIIINKNRYDYFKERITELVAESKYMGIMEPNIYYNSDKDEIYDINNVNSHSHTNPLPYVSKTGQPDDDKQYMLTKAKLKRLKRNRKKTLLNPPNNIHICDINKEIEDLENILKLIKG